MKNRSHHLRGNKTKKIQSFDLIIFIHSWIDVEGRHRQPDIWEYKHLKEIELNVEEILFSSREPPNHI